VVARQERNPQRAAREPATMTATRNRTTVRRLNPWLIRRTMPGKTSPLIQRRSVPMAPMSMATGWRCLSELILLPRQRGDAVANLDGDRGRELGDLVRPSRGVKDDRGQPEPALQRSLTGVYVLDAGQRHERAGDPQDSPLQVDLIGPDLVAPPSPAQPRRYADDHATQQKDRKPGQDGYQR